MLNMLDTIKKPGTLLIVILAVAALLRLYGLGTAEFFHDEGLYAFRSIGYLDFLNNDAQTTPLQWFRDAAEVPFWTKLSFHDHPPLFFLIQRIFFLIFGDSLFIARLPSVISGVGAVFLMWLIAKRLFKRIDAGLVAAALLAVNHIHVWVSRSSLIESFLIFLLLANLYMFLRAREEQRWWLWFWVTLALALLTKYTAGFVIPVYLLYLLVQERSILARGARYLYAGIALCVFMLLPVIVYNIFLFKTTGHFDLQIAYILGQETPEWQGSIGKLQEPFSTILITAPAMYSWPFLLLSFLGFGLSLWRFIAKKEHVYALGVYGFLATLLLFVFIGAAFRFLSLYIVVGTLLIVVTLGALERIIKKRTIVLTGVGLLIAYEAFFAWQGVFIEFPDFRTTALDRYLNGVFSQGTSIIPQHPNKHLNKIILQHLPLDPMSAPPRMVVYDENINLSARLWLFTRRELYHGISSVTAGNFKRLLQQRGPGSFSGYEIYFIRAGEMYITNPIFFSQDAAEFETFLIQDLELDPVERMVNGYGQEMIRVYTFTI